MNPHWYIEAFSRSKAFLSQVTVYCMNSYSVTMITRIINVPVASIMDQPYWKASSTIMFVHFCEQNLIVISRVHLKPAQLKFCMQMEVIILAECFPSYDNIHNIHTHTRQLYLTRTGEQNYRKRHNCVIFIMRIPVHGKTKLILKLSSGWGPSQYKDVILPVKGSPC